MNPAGNTTSLVQRSKRFVLNIPRASQAQAVMAFGMVSGRFEDKFQHKYVQGVFSCDPETLVIPECAAHLFCQAGKSMPSPDNATIIITATIEKCLVDSDLFDVKTLRWKFDTDSLGPIGKDDQTQDEPILLEKLHKMTLSSLTDSEFVVNGTSLKIRGSFEL